MTLENGLKAAMIGAFAGLVIWALLVIGGRANGLLPFDTPPTTAFLLALGVEWRPAGVLLHFALAIAGSLALVALFRQETDALTGVIVGAGLWLFAMLVMSPLIGWGAFGYGGGQEVPLDHALHLDPGPRYAAITLALALLYGLLIGLGNALWCSFPQPRRRGSRARWRSTITAR